VRKRVDKHSQIRYTNVCCGRLAQLGERLPYKQDVGSSSLSSPTIWRSSSVG
jgi:hypothetical protein